jgi:hypothetical protein
LIAIVLGCRYYFTELRVPRSCIAHRERSKYDLGLSSTIRKELETHGIIVQSKPGNAVVFKLKVGECESIVKVKFNSGNGKHNVESSPVLLRRP